jgi:hypothetical protein
MMKKMQSNKKDLENLRQNEELMERLYQKYLKLGCKECAMWDEAAIEIGKRGMCKECFEIYCDPTVCNVERLGLPLAIEWKSKEELLHMYPE